MSLASLCIWYFLKCSKTQSTSGPQVTPIKSSDPDSDRQAAFGLGYLALLGFINVVPVQYLFAYSVNLTSIAMAVTLQYTAPIFVTVLSRFIYKEPITVAKLTGLAVAVAGLSMAVGIQDVLLGGELSISPLAIAVGLTSGFFYGLYTLLLKRLSLDYHPVYLNIWVMGSGALSAFILATLTRTGIVVPSGWISWRGVLLLSFGPGLLGFYMYTIGLSRVESSRASIVATVEPVAAGLLGYLVFEEMISPVQAIGMGMVITGIAFVGLEAKLKHDLVPSRVYCEEKADTDHVHYQRTAAVACKGEGQSGDGH